MAAPEGEQDLRRHLFWRIDRAERADLAAQIVARHASTVVFCRTKRGADRLARQMHQAGLAVAAIHGDRSQPQREKALAAFSDGRVQALVATDVAARGIHVDAVGCVLHFDPPEDEKAYVHRSGRTGRAGAGGTVLTLVTNEVTSAVKVMQKALGFPRGATAPDLRTLGEVVAQREAGDEGARGRRSRSGRRGNGPSQPARPGASPTAARPAVAATGAPRPDGRPDRTTSTGRAQRA